MNGSDRATLSFNNAELADLFDPLRAYATVAIAVSGGGDSMALLHLYSQWCASVDHAPVDPVSVAPISADPSAKRSAHRSAVTPPFTSLILTVDHQLRPGSADDAEIVAGAARQLGWPHETLPWFGNKPPSSIQAAARDARYRLMTDRLRDLPGPVALLTAHTRCDQAETVLMRLARGSGIAGLSGMERVRPLLDNPRIDLVRPLLTIPGQRLRAWLTARGIGWIDDPTNRNLAHERPQFRAARRELEALGLTGEAITRSADRLRRADRAVVWATKNLAETTVTEIAGVCAKVTAAPFTAAPAELRIRLLGALLARYGGQHPSPLLSEIERLDAALSAHAQPVSEKWTLGGCIIISRDGLITIHRELGRAPLPQMTLSPGQTAVWDDRFTVFLPATVECPETVAALSVQQWSSISAMVAPYWRKEMALTAPAALFAAELRATAAVVPNYSAVGVPAVIP